MALECPSFLANFGTDDGTAGEDDRSIVRSVDRVGAETEMHRGGNGDRFADVAESVDRRAVPHSLE